MKNKEITAKTKMNELIKDKPEAVGLLFEAGMGCVGCHMAQLETLEQGCMAHGMSKEEIDEIVRKINALSQAKPLASTLRIKGDTETRVNAR